MGITEVFRALGDPTRREMIRLLRRGDLTAGELAERFDLARSTLSEHCAVLKDAGLVVTERQGTKVVYSLNTSTTEDALAAVLELFGADRTNVSERSRSNQRSRGIAGTDGATRARTQRKEARP